MPRLAPVMRASRLDALGGRFERARLFLSEVRTVTEPVLASYRLPVDLVFRSVSGPVNGSDSVAFDNYLGDPSLVDRIVTALAKRRQRDQSPASISGL